MRQYQKKTEETEQVKKIICNQCGKEIAVSNGCEEEGVFHAEYSWGYFSRKDGEKHRFDLCEDCYDAFVHTFQIPIEIEG